MSLEGDAETVPENQVSSTHPGSVRGHWGPVPLNLSKHGSLMKFMLLLLTMSFSALAGPDFPTAPDSRLTTGTLCDVPVEYRYSEQIKYCGRDVATETKNEIFVAYRRLGYLLPSGSRKDYKIDHYVPLCMGGSNRTNNLWPQHVSIFTQTDSLEEAICAKMKEGRMLQVDAVKMIKAVKNDLRLIPTAFAQLARL